MAVFTTSVALRWADVDSLGHVNNAVIFTLLEESRVHFIRDLMGTPTERPFGLVVARNEADYLRPMYYSLDPVDIRVWVERVGTASFTVMSEIDQAGHTAVRSRTVVVALVPGGSGSTPLPDSAREALTQYLV